MTRNKLRNLRRWLLPGLALAAAIGIRAEYGYFIARDPCVAFLYVLVGIKFLEARGARDGALLVCLALFLALTQFFYAQTILAAVAAMPALLATGVALAVLRTPAGATEPWRPHLRATVRLILQGVPIAALLFVLFPRLAGPLWGSPLESGARTGLSESMSPGSISDLSLSDEVAFRVEFTGAPPPPSQRYWRGPVFSRFDGVTWRPLYKLRIGQFVPPAGRPSDYTVTMEPHGKLWLFALEHPTGPPRAPSPDAPAGVPTEALAAVTYDQQLLAKAPVTQAVRYTVRSATVGTFAAVTNDASDNLQVPRGNPRTIEFARDLRARSASDRAYIAAVLDWFRTESFVYTLAPDASRPGSGRRLPVRHAPRLLRALCRRIRFADARRRHSVARRHRIPGRRNEPDRRVHDRAPVRCARLGGGAARREVAAGRSDRRGRTVAHRARHRRGTACRRARSLPCAGSR